MRAGTLNSRVTLSQLTAGQDAIGQPTQVWTTLATVWADVRYLSGVEAIRADAQGSTTKASVRIRRRTDVTSAMRVLFGATTFEIKAVLPDEQDRQRLDLVCEVVS